MSLKKIIFLAVPAVVFIIDQISKRYITSAFRLHESLEVIPDFFQITYIQNKGAAFGILSEVDSPWVAPFFVAMTLTATGALLWLYYKASPKNFFLLFGLTLLLGGAMGNFADRLLLGSVVDFLDVHWKEHHWPAFNVADSAITVGIFLFVLDVFLNGHGEKGS